MTRRMIGVVVVLMAMSLMICGCISPPDGTVLIDTPGGGRALAADEDRNGVADLDAEGKPKILVGSEGYGTAESVDAFAPGLLATIGGITGLPILIGIAAAWRHARFGRIFMNTVMSVQAARQRLKDKGNVEALAIVDETLSTQVPATIKEIKRVKEKLGLVSVTES